jgi:hypothetical protein
MNLQTLETLNDDDLRAVGARCEQLLVLHDKQRKEKALEEAKAILAASGLTLKDLAGVKAKAAKGPVYKGGLVYQHPSNKTLIWHAKGKKPRWLVELEAVGGTAREVANA